MQITHGMVHRICSRNIGGEQEEERTHAFSGEVHNGRSRERASYLFFWLRLLALRFACALVHSLLFVAGKSQIGIRRILSLFLSWIRVCTVMSEHHTAMDTAAVESETMKKPPLVDRALIVGGGLGGLAAAIQLRKFGIDAQVRQTDRELDF